jgi:hypothetical protein
MNPIYKLISLVFFLIPFIAIGQDKRISQAEYYWDTDPGIGNGTSLSAFDSNLDEVVESVISQELIELTPGLHSLNIRFMDAQNGWSNSFCHVSGCSRSAF